MIRGPLIFATVLLASCSGLATQGVDVRGDAAILSADKVPELLNQCSRDTPPAGESTWRPEWRQIDALEAILPHAVASHDEGERLSSRQPPDGWIRQYVGIVRNGRRFIYGNYFPRSDTPPLPLNDPTRLVLICDGGPAYFGVEYDVQTRRITHLAFNGVA